MCFSNHLSKKYVNSTYKTHRAFSRSRKCEKWGPRKRRWWKSEVWWPSSGHMKCQKCNKHVRVCMFAAQILVRLNWNVVHGKGWSCVCNRENALAHSFLSLFSLTNTEKKLLLLRFSFHSHFGPTYVICDRNLWMNLFTASYIEDLAIVCFRCICTHHDFD